MMISLKPKIMRETNPFKIKKLGNKVHNFLQMQWLCSNKAIVYAAVLHKIHPEYPVARYPDENGRSKNCGEF